MLSQNDSIEIDFKEFTLRHRRQVDRRPGGAVQAADQHPRPVEAGGEPEDEDAAPQPQLRRQDRLPRALDADGADAVGGRRGDRRRPADQQARRTRAARSRRDGRRGRLRPALRGAGAGAGSRWPASPRERAPLRRDPSAVRGFRRRVGDRDRVARSRRRPATRAGSRPCRSSWPRRSTRVADGPLRGRALHARRTCSRSNTRACCTTSARSACARSVLVKAKKLYEEDLRTHQAALRATSRRRSRPSTPSASCAWRWSWASPTYAARFADIDARAGAAGWTRSTTRWRSSARVNEPTVLDQGGFERLVEIARLVVPGARRRAAPVPGARGGRGAAGAARQPDRRRARRDREPRRRTPQFLQKIPWGRRYADVPRIAAAHHEYLNGSGYPSRLRRARTSPSSRAS